MDRARFGNFVLYSLAGWGFVSGVLALVLTGVVLASLTFATRSLSDAEAPNVYPVSPAPPPMGWDASPGAAAEFGAIDGLGATGSGMGGGGLGAGDSGIGSLRGSASKSAVLQFLTTRGDSGDGSAKDLFSADQPADVATTEAPTERMRSWFPEAFLWRPLVETDVSGTATVDVRVPDQLTTWRVLALAHTRAGAQAGDIVTFDSALPLYVDPVVPAWMYAGDHVDLPVQVVNTTDQTVTAPLTVTSDGALSGQAIANLTLPAGGTAVGRVTLTAAGAGDSHVTATLSGGDAVQREIPVLPRGRPVETTRGGTVSSTTAFTLTGPDDADPATEELSVLVYPGPLAVLHSEVERGGQGGTAADAAYGFALATRLADLSRATKVDVDAAVVRRLRILAWQRVVIPARSPDAGGAADLLAGLRGTTDHEQALELQDRLQRRLAEGQRGDGTWSRGGSGTLQRVLVETGFAARQLGDAQTGPRLKARGAIARQIAQVNDPYTAAVVLASGLVDGDDALRLQTLITDAATDAGDGRKTLAVPADALNPWGWRPSKPELLAWAVLALPADVPWRGDLVAELMTGYDATWGFGAGPADVIALEAIATALPGVDQPIDVTLTIDGAAVSQAKLDPAQPKLPARLDTKGATGEIAISVSPAVPGLAFVATRRSWIAWSGTERLPGVDVEVAADAMTAGDDATITLTLSAPSGTALVIEQGLPAGAVVDEDALSGISDRIVDYTVKTDRVRLVTRAFQAGEAMVVPIRVRPAFVGKFSTVPLTVEDQDGGAQADIAPLVWVVAE